MHDLDVVLNGIKIARRSCIKYLGVLIDENLKWGSHVNSVASIISRNVGVMGRARYYLSSKQLVLLYNTLVLPYLNYCAVVWGRNYETALKKLLLLQKRAIRIIDKKCFLFHTKSLFIKYKILRFPEIVREQCIMILLAYINKNLPGPMSSMFQYSKTSRTRSTQHFFVPFASTNYRLFAMSCCAPKIWNESVGSLYGDGHMVPKGKCALKKVLRGYFLREYEASDT